MAIHRVIWEIDIDAESSREAAEKALEIQRDVNSTATHFTVITMQSDDFNVDYIDFHEGENNASSVN
jgi:nucleotide-binding universal stress UspA family protein